VKKAAKRTGKRTVKTTAKRTAKRARAGVAARRKTAARRDELRELIHPDRARSDELGRTTVGDEATAPAPGPRELPAREVDPLAHEREPR
jgi:hypothetical protein